MTEYDYFTDVTDGVIDAVWRYPKGEEKGDYLTVRYYRTKATAGRSDWSLKRAYRILDAPPAWVAEKFGEE